LWSANVIREGNPGHPFSEVLNRGDDLIDTERRILGRKGTRGQKEEGKETSHGWKKK